MGSSPSNSGEDALRSTLTIDNPLDQLGAPSEIGSIGNIIEPEAVGQVAFYAMTSQSPWPSPGMIKEYQDLNPKLARDLIVELKKEAAARRERDRRREVESDKRQNRSQYFAFTLATLGVVAAGVFGYLGVSDYVCITIVLVAIGGPNTATVIARRIDRAKDNPKT